MSIPRRTPAESVAHLEGLAADPSVPEVDRWCYRQGADALRTLHQLPRYPGASANRIPGAGETGVQVANHARDAMERAGATPAHIREFDADVAGAQTWGELHSVFARWVSLRSPGEAAPSPAPSPPSPRTLRVL